LNFSTFPIPKTITKKPGQIHYNHPGPRIKPNKNHLRIVNEVRIQRKDRPLPTPPTQAEAALIEKARHGDRNAYGELVRQHHQGVINVVYRMCGDQQLAEDAAQDAFIQAWLNLSKFKPGTSLRNWLYRIAVNAALDSLRRITRTPFDAFENLSLPDPQAGPETALLQKERLITVQQATSSLPEASRAVLVLREYGGLSYQEISAALDIPLGTVMSRLNYARDKLKQTLTQELLDTEREYA
jgi:RNA polymerase sigma-70 factor, ECF subfamily